jgi:hypothetical protein
MEEARYARITGIYFAVLGVIVLGLHMLSGT